MSRNISSADQVLDNRPADKNYLSLILFVALALVEAGAGLAWAGAWLSSTTFLTCHVVVVCLLAFVWYWGRGTDLRLMPFGFIGVLFAGPLGAAGFVLLVLVTSISKPDTHLLDEWYRKLAGSRNRDEQSILYQSIVSERAVGSRPSTVKNFNLLVSEGTLEEKQSLLGMVAVKYHPDFFPILKTALRDSEPVVRVQAAAAFAKLRMGFKTKFSTALSLGQIKETDQLDPTERVAILQECIGSGFLDEPEVIQATSAIRRYESVV